MRMGYRHLAALAATSSLVARSTAFHAPRSLRLRRALRMMTSSGSDGGNTLRVALCQFPVTTDKAANHRTCADYIGRAAAQGAQLVVLPEIWNSPYATLAFPDYAEPLPDVGGAPDAAAAPSAALLREQARQHQVWLVGGSVPEVRDGRYYNTCLVFRPDGAIVAKHRKMHLFDIDVPGKITFRESDTLTGGDTVSTFALPDGTLVGVGICYDIRFAEYAQLLRRLGCRILVYPGAFNLTTGPLHWELLQRGRANDNQCFVLTASPARTEPPPPAEGDGDGAATAKYPHYAAWGHSTAVSPWGRVLATRDETPGIVVADLDLGEVEEVRSAIPIGNQARTDVYKLVEPVE